jgi:hypothetical protein
MRKLFISFVTAVLLASCSADSLMKETELDLTDTEKVYSDITLTRKVAYDLYARMRMGRDRLGSFGFLANIGGSPCMLDNATDDGAGNTKSTSICHYTGKIYAHGTFGIKYNT